MIIHETSIVSQDVKEIKAFESKYKMMPAELSKIQLKTNSKIYESLEMRYQDKIFTSILDEGFRNYCKLLKIPHSYAIHEIPHDLLIRSVQRLREWKKAKEKRVMIIFYDNVLVNIIEADKFAVLPKPSKLLTQLGDMGVKMEGTLIKPTNEKGSINKFSNFKHCYVGDKGATVDILIPGNETVLEVNGDKIGFGVRIDLPFTGFGNKIKIDGFLHQWACSNGMMVGMKFISEDLSTGLMKFGLDSYINYLMTSKINFDKLQKNLIGMTKEKVTYKYLKIMWNRIQKVNPTVFEHVFQLQDRNKYEFLKTRLMSKTYEDEKSPFNYFEIMYDTTQQSQNLRSKAPRKQQSLEEFSNKMFELYLRQTGQLPELKR